MRRVRLCSSENHAEVKRISQALDRAEIPHECRLPMEIWTIAGEDYERRAIRIIRQMGRPRKKENRLHLPKTQNTNSMASGSAGGISGQVSVCARNREED